MFARRVRLGVRTPASHVGNTGSIPVRATTFATAISPVAPNPSPAILMDFGVFLWAKPCKNFAWKVSATTTKGLGNFAQILRQNVGVDFGGLDIGMSLELLDFRQVDALAHQIRCGRMFQAMQM